MCVLSVYVQVDASIGVESMMGHLVFGRYGSQDAAPAQHKESWMHRLLRNLLAHTPLRLR